MFSSWPVSRSASVAEGEGKAKNERMAGIGLGVGETGRLVDGRRAVKKLPKIGVDADSVEIREIREENVEADKLNGGTDGRVVEPNLCSCSVGSWKSVSKLVRRMAEKRNVVGTITQK